MVIGYGAAEDIPGAKDAGTIPEAAGPGKEDIGNTVTGDTTGTEDTGGKI
jgi:hypothetical protein